MAENIKVRICFPRPGAKLVGAFLAAIVAIIGESIVNAFGSEIDDLFFHMVSTMTGYIGPHPWAWVFIVLSIFGAIFLIGSPFIIFYIITLHTAVNRYDLLWRV